MLPNHHNSDTRARYAIGKLTLYGLILSLVTNVLLAAILLTSTNTHRETLVPPTINKTFWVDDAAVSPEYLEQMAVFLLQLALNVTPANAEINHQAFMRYVAPANFGQIQKSLRSQVAELKELNVSTAFYPSSVALHPNHPNTIVVSGISVTWAADRRLPDRSVAYRLRFNFAGGRVHLAELVETNERTPFDHENPTSASPAASGTDASR